MFFKRSSAKKESFLFFLIWREKEGENAMLSSNFVSTFFSVKIQQREFIFAHSSINSLVQTNDFCLVLTIFQNRSEIVEGRMIGGEIFFIFFARPFFLIFREQLRYVKSKSIHHIFATFFIGFSSFFSDCILVSYDNTSWLNTANFKL